MPELECDPGITEAMRAEGGIGTRRLLDRLHEAADAGDERGLHAAWNALIAPIRGALVRFAARRLPREGLGGWTAEDFVQEVCARVLATWRKFRYAGEARAIGWFRLAAWRMLADRVRSLRNRPAPAPLPADGAVCRAADIAPAEAAGRAEVVAAVRSRVASLPAAEREAVEAVDFDGLTCVEAARRLGKLPNTVVVARRRAFRRLQAMLAEWDPGRGMVPARGRRCAS